MNAFESDGFFLDMRASLQGLEPQLLGTPGYDNALYVKVLTGQSIHRVLFDCGEACASSLSSLELSRVDFLFFSHLHFDHIAGFDHILRINFDREPKPLVIFGPPRTAEILHHRLQGVLWDRVEGSGGEFLITDISHESLTTYRFRSNDGFRGIELVGRIPFQGVIVDLPEFQVEVVILDHGSPSIGYALSMKPTWNVATERLKELQLTPGPWLQKVKDPHIPADTELMVGQKMFRIGELRNLLLVSKPGEKLGYLTDFRFDEHRLGSIESAFRGCDMLVCENNYRDGDEELARKHFHATSSEVATIAKAIDAKNLILFHLSDRYQKPEWFELLSDVRKKHSRTFFAQEWQSFLEQATSET